MERTERDDKSQQLAAMMGVIESLELDDYDEKKRQWLITQLQKMMH